MDITFPGLQSINNGVSMAFNSQLYAAPSLYKRFTFENPSTGDAEVYPRLDMLPGLREWIGERNVHSLTQETFAISNKLFEETIGIRREQIEDDKYGLLTPVASQLGLDAGQLPDKLVASLFLNGHSTTIYDGQNFFDTAHPNYPQGGAPSPTSTVANYQAAGGNTGPSWYLIDGSKILKPFIYQTRRPFKIVPKFSLTDPSVFFDNEFIWGVDGRCNAGYGLPMLAFRSDAALTVANLIAARTLMASWRRPDGTPMGISPSLLVVPTALLPAAKTYCENEFLPAGDPLATGGTVANTFRGLATAVENMWLN
jgi:phage major head subunit gpT-like protein